MNTILLWVQAAEMGFLRRVHGSKLGDKMLICRIRKALNLEPLPWIKISQPGYVLSVMCPKCPRKDWRGTFFWLRPPECVPKVNHGPAGVTASPTLLGPVLVWNQQNYLKFLKTVTHFVSSYGCPCPLMTILRDNTGIKMDKSTVKSAESAFTWCWGLLIVALCS